MKLLRSLFTATLLPLTVIATAGYSGTVVEGSIQVHAGASLSVDADFGDIAIKGSSSNNLTYKLILDDKLDKELDVFCYQSGKNLEIRLDARNKYKLFRKYSPARARLEINVPEGMSLNVKSRWGNLNLSDISSTAELQTKNGSIEVSTHDGYLRANAAGGGITLRGINGKVNARTHGEQIRIEGYDGDVVARAFNQSVVISGNDESQADCLLTSNGGEISISQQKISSGQPSTLLCSWDGELTFIPGD